MSQSDEINHHITQIEESLKALRILTQNPNGLKPYKKFPIAESLPADDLGKIPDYKSNEWPVSIQPNLIASQDKAIRKFRALQIIALTNLSFENKQVLDCGCGDGSIASELSQITKVIGYDINDDARWREYTNNNLLFTTDKETINSFKFDIIFLYDVIDHLEKENPIFFMQWLKKLLAPNGIIFIRTHPWTAIHGGHLYENMNKAYLHLALTNDELNNEKLVVPHNLKIVRPIAAYDSIFEQAELKITQRKSYTNFVDDYIIDNVLDRIIKITWRGAIDRDTAIKIMSNQFIDYILINEDINQ